MRKLRNKKTIQTILDAAERAERGYLSLEKTDAYLAFSAEVIRETENGKLLAISHTSIQNGDLMRDPEVVILCGKDGNFYPVEYRNDYLPKHDNAVQWENGKIKAYAPRLQNSIASFADVFARNLREQGFAKRAKAAK